MKTATQVLIGVILTIGFVIFIGYKITSYEPPKPKEIDMEKVGKTIGDMKRDFLKGFNDTTKVKTDSIK